MMGFFSMDGGSDAMVAIIFILVIVVFAVIIIKGIGEWNQNNHSLRQDVNAVVVSKRTEVSQHRHANAGDSTGAHGYHTTVVSSHYVTFQVESGGQIEFSMDGSEYGTLMEGDRGKLSFQGTRYLGFERVYW